MAENGPRNTRVHFRLVRLSSPACHSFSIARGRADGSTARSVSTTDPAVLESAAAEGPAAAKMESDDLEQLMPNIQQRAQHISPGNTVALREYMKVRTNRLPDWLSPGARSQQPSRSSATEGPASASAFRRC